LKEEGTNFHICILRIASFLALVFASSSSFADNQSDLRQLGGAIGVSYGLGQIGNAGMGLPSRTMGLISIDALPGYLVGNCLIGIDFDYSFSNQYSSLASAGGTNLKGDQWSLGIGAKYNLVSRWSLQGAIGFVGQYNFAEQTNLSSSQHAGIPIAFRLKPQFFPIENVPFSIDLDLQYFYWQIFTVGNASNGTGTSEWNVGVGITYHYKRTENE